MKLEYIEGTVTLNISDLDKLREKAAMYDELKEECENDRVCLICCLVKACKEISGFNSKRLEDILSEIIHQICGNDNAECSKLIRDVKWYL